MSVISIDVLIKTIVIRLGEIFISLESSRTFVGFCVSQSKCSDVCYLLESQLLFFIRELFVVRVKHTGILL